MVVEDERMRVRRWLVNQRGSPPQGRQYSAPSEAGEVVVDGNPKLQTTGERWNAGHKGW